MSNPDTRSRAETQGQAQFGSICKLVAALHDSGDDAARAAIIEDALSVQVRSGWHQPGHAAPPPEEFEILLCWGGPSVRLTGRLDQHGEPESAALQVQDWFTPWTDFTPADALDCDEVLLAYARCFYFAA